MNELAEKLRSLEPQIASEQGPFALFALFLRDNAPDLWDLLVSAPWIEVDKGSALRYIVSKLKEAITAAELTSLSRVVIIDGNNPALNAIHSAIHVEHGIAEVQESIFFGLRIKHAYIITSKRLGA
jgi:hypothetical protein